MTAFCSRHPLFVAAVVASACVLLAAKSLPAAAALALLLGIVGRLLRDWRIGLIWALCGGLGIGVFAWRNHARDAAETELLETGPCEMQGCLLKDGKGGGNFWAAPAVLLGGPQAGTDVLWQGRGAPPVAGAVVKAAGNFGPLPEMRNPGEFDQAAWLRNQGVAAVFLASGVTGEVTTGYRAALGAQIRRSFRAAVTAGLAEDSQEAVVIRAVVIGEQPPDADELVAAFRNSGTLHAFSVSGMHVAMVGMIVWWVIRLAGVPRRQAVWLMLPLIFGYSWITGNSPPAVRAAWMFSVYLGAFVTRRRPDLLNALGAVLLAAALWDGRLLFQPGVQLSYGVVATMAVSADWATRIFAWIAEPELYLPLELMSWRQRKWLWVRTKVAQSLGVSVAAALGSTPLTIYHFGLVTPVSILAGGIFGLLVFVLLGLSLLAAALYPIVPGGSGWVNKVNAVVAKSCVRTAEFFASVPGGHFQISQENAPSLLVYDLERGAGSACFSDGRGAAVLLDCGDPRGFKRKVAPSLKRLGVAPDAVILTHPDGDHLGGGELVWKLFPIRQVLLPVGKARSPAFRAWVGDAPAAGIRTRQAKDFHDLPMPDGARLEILYVPDLRSQNAAADDRVVIYRLHWRGWKLLFTSDSGMGEELKMLDAGVDLSADVIIAGRHHGDRSLCDRFLDAVNPQAIVASHADFPVTEKLDPETVEYWKSRGIQVMNQGKSGGVTFRIDGSGHLRLEGFADQSVMVLKPR